MSGNYYKCVGCERTVFIPPSRKRIHKRGHANCLCCGEQMMPLSDSLAEIFFISFMCVVGPVSLLVSGAMYLCSL